MLVAGQGPGQTFDLALLFSVPSSGSNENLDRSRSPHGKNTPDLRKDQVETHYGLKMLHALDYSVRDLRGADGGRVVGARFDIVGHKFPLGHNGRQSALQAISSRALTEMAQHQHA